jgi:hypothetical protein
MPNSTGSDRPWVRWVVAVAVTVDRRRVLHAGLAVVVGVAAGTLVNAGIDEGDQAGPAADESEPERAEAPPTTDPVSLSDLADAVEVVETGFTIGSWEFCNGVDRDPSDGCSGCSVANGCGTHPPVVQHLVSHGLIVHNRSDHLLERIPLTISFLDEAGQPIHSPAGSEVEISRLLPNETVGLGDVVVIDSGGTKTMAVEVGSPAEAMSVDFARATGDLAGLLEVTASDVRVFGPGAVELELRPTEWLVLYGLQASLPEGVPSGDEHARVFAVPQVVLRDAGDHIVGWSRRRPDRDHRHNARAHRDQRGLRSPRLSHRLGGNDPGVLHRLQRGVAAMDQVMAWMQKRWRGLLGLFAVAVLSFAEVVDGSHSFEGHPIVGRAGHDQRVSIVRDTDDVVAVGQQPHGWLDVRKEAVVR